MTVLLTLLSSVIWWVLYSSVGAIVPALIVWLVLRWSERVPVVFNRAYLACLIWCLFVILVSAGVAAHIGVLRPPLTPLLASNLFRLVLAISMLVGVLTLWRLIPRIDARRIRLASACMAVAVVMAIGFGVLTTLASR
ncbi:hypothetical protein ACFFJT_05085 [Dyella flava]|uniref:Uncharacterized protein n=1 Tax=Dyella flava TaxID=1920170 RepID=A0ABS2K8S5_9GAMM|nr:hypothetical protein [Dyella flava]MBM7126728.1 hypothetical protein [Dyella flava]GLQ49449.1 hypothetical protein GCM10010872_08980 [Dyella flava]